MSLGQLPRPDEIQLTCSLGEFSLEVVGPDELSLRARRWAIPGCKNRVVGTLYITRPQGDWQIGINSLISLGATRNPVRYSRIKQDVLPVILPTIETFLTRNKDQYLRALRVVLQNKWVRIQNDKQEWLKEVEQAEAQQIEIDAQLAEVDQNLTAWLNQQHNEPIEDVTF